ncbi:MAG: ATP-binding cassette domain-containing protein, partial [Chloroflexota bacterium]|nr:ATP-binding cassette domain-containing protein [Chloroflexota bacterium]
MVNVRLKVEDVSLKFGGLQALDRINFDINDGEILAIIGPNGAGKTSLFNCLSGFYRPQEGRILFEGQDITQLPSHKIASMGISRTFQNIELYTHMSALDNLMAGRHIKVKSNTLA